MSSQATSHRLSGLAAGLLVCAFGLLALAPNASAFTTRFPPLASFGPDGTSGTSFDNSPEALGFDQSLDRVYVLNRNPVAATQGIHGFDASAPPTYTPLGGFPLPVVTPGFEAGLAVDNTALPSAGNIYFASASTHEVHGFDSAGAPLGGNFPIAPAAPRSLCGAAVDSTGNIYVGDRDPNVRAIRVYDPAGNPAGTVDTSSQGGQPCFIGFDSDEDMLVGFREDHGGGVWRYEAPSYTAATRISPETQGPSEGVRGVAVDASADHLYLITPAEASAYDTVAGGLLYDFAFGVPGAAFRGVAVDEATDTVYVADNGNDQVHAYGPAVDLPEATVVLHPAQSVTASSAEISATIDDNSALPTNWRLEVSEDEGASWAGAASGQTAGSETGALVSAALSGLFPNFAYCFRVVVNKGKRPSTEVVSASECFTTDAAPPEISSTGAVQIADTSARLVATIDPRNSETSYVFRYGPTEALAEETEALAIGGGLEPVVVSQVVEGLDKDTEYFFRAVATNPAGTTEGPLASFRTRALPIPPSPDRGYELVSPVEKGFTDFNQGGIEGPLVALDGEALATCSQALFGEEPSRMLGTCAPYLTRRTGEGPTGWETTNPFPAYCPDDPGSGAEDWMDVFPSADVERFVLRKPESASCPIPPLDPAAPLLPNAQAPNLYLQDDPLAATPAYRLLNPLSAVPLHTDQPVPLGGSEDFSHILFLSNENQTSPPDSPAPGDFRKLYEFVVEGADCGPGSPGHDASLGGCLRLVTKDAGGAPFATSSAPPTLSTYFGTSFALDGVSADGRRIYFQNPHASAFTSDLDYHKPNPCINKGCEVYLREDGEATFDVSATGCTVGECGTPQDSADVFIATTPSGAEAFFTSCARLTDASAPEAACGSGPWGNSGIGGNSGVAGSKLYRWDRDLPEGARLVDLTADQEPADGPQPDFRGLIGQSDDGETAFFVASGQIVAGEPTGAGEKLYRWQWNGGAPEVDYLGPYQTLSGTLFNGESTNADFNWGQKHLHVTPDGEHLLLYTRLGISVADADEDADAYRWSEAEGWICVSCQLPGTPSAGDIERAERKPIELGTTGPDPIQDEVRKRYFMSEDGQSVFFATPDALVPQDTNGKGGCPAIGGIPTCTDVYLWQEGKVELVSSGTGSEAARLITSTPSGEDVFFYTREKLIGWDTDELVDIYDARVDGGFDEPPPGDPICKSPEECRGDPVPVPPVPTIPKVEHPGNPPPVRDCRAAARRAKKLANRAKRGRRGARRLARGGKRGRARALQRRSGRLAKKARRSSRKAKRCRRENRRARR